MVSLFDTTPDGFARCAVCNAARERAKMHARADGLHLCAKCKREQDREALDRQQNKLFQDNRTTESMF